MIFLVAGPLFWGSNSPNLSKRGLAASILDFHGPTFHFLAAGPKMFSAELESRPCSGKLACFLSWLAFFALQKRAPRNLTLGFCWAPLCAVSGLDPPKRGPVTWLQTCFRTPFPSIFNTLL